MAVALDDLRKGRPDRAPDAEHVDLEDAFPFLARHPPRGRHLRRGDPGVGDDDVEAAEALDRLRHRAHHRPVVGDVGADPDRPLADPLGRLARLLGVEVEHRDRGAAQLQLPRGLVADAAGRAGDQRHLSVQVEGRHRPAAYWSRSARLGWQRVSDRVAPTSTFAEARGLEQVGQLDAGPLTPLLVESKSCRLRAGGPRPLLGSGRRSRRPARLYPQQDLPIQRRPDRGPGVDRVRAARLLHPPGPPHPRRRVLRLRGARLETLDRERRPQRALPGQHQPVPGPELAAPAVRARASSTGSATEPPADFSFELAYGALLGSIEEDEPTPAALAALCDATAHVAERIASECEE